MRSKDKLQNSVLFLPANKSVAFRPGESVLELSERLGLGVQTSCGGMGSCGACRVIVESDVKALPERNHVEQEMADYRDYVEKERLACQLECFDGLAVRIPED